MNDQRVIQARLVVRGFKDLQAAQPSTYAGTTTRRGQRLVNSVAAQHQWPLFTAYVSQAFRRGLTFEQVAHMKDEVERDVQFTVPPGSTHLLKKLPGFSDFNPLKEVLRMLRCGFGLKDAPRLWNKVLRRVLQALGLSSTQADPQLYVWHAPESSHGGESSLTRSDSSSKKRLVLILSTHVDDFKGAGEEPFVKRLLAGLEKEFATLKVKRGVFECVGIIHEQDPQTFEVWTHQQHYLPQIKEIPADAKALVPDEEPADEDLGQLFMSLVGALAWLILTIPSIGIYVAYLQRQTKSPNMGHIRRANRLLRWLRRHSKRLGVWFRRLRAPIRVMTLSDSAFKAQDFQGLVMRGCIVLLVESTNALSDESSSTNGNGREVCCQVLDWYARKHSRVVRSTYAAELLSLLDAIGQGNLVATAIEEIQSGAMTARQLLDRHSDCQRSIEHDAGIDARAVFDGITAAQPRTPAEKPLFLHALAVREHLEAGHLSRLWWFDTRAMLADGLTKGAVDRDALVKVCEQGLWIIEGDAPIHKRLREQ